ncbi:MAG: hypothetical protein JWM98_1763, partial [Thermoleophilia bacterium]|nr:hypothetical protein [Thermoleophilia bacterium]
GARRLLVAATDVVAWTIPSATVRAACVREPRLVGALVAVADGDAADVRELASELATLGFPQRLARLLLRLLARRGRATLRGEAMVDAVLTNEQLARMCGSQRPRVSTLMATWKRDGIIDTWKRRTVVLDTARLRDAAGLATPADARPADA